MKKTVSVLVAGALVVSAGVWFALSGSASASPTGLRAGGGPAGRTVPQHAAPVTPGTTWTLYDYEDGPSMVFCEVLSFSGFSVFSGSHGTGGKWKSTATKTTLTVTAPGTFPVGKFTGTFATVSKLYAGLMTTSSGTFGPLSLVAGSDPYGLGTC